MAKYYISNENGDWWTINAFNGAGQRLFIISEAELAEVVAEENPEDAGADLATIDGLAGVIISKGEAIDFEFSL